MVKWQSVARQAVKEEPIEADAINSEEELMSFVHHCNRKISTLGGRQGWLACVLG